MEKETKIALVILIAIILVFGGFYLLLYMFLPPPYNGHWTPSANLTATPSNTGCEILIETPSQDDIPWSDVWYVLLNYSGGEEEYNSSQVIIPRTNVVRDGDMITISEGLVENFSYRFVLIYNVTYGVIGYAIWTQ